MGRENDLNDAVLAVQERKMTIRAAAKNFAVPYPTLRRWCKGKPGKHGRQALLTEDEEAHMVKLALSCES